MKLEIESAEELEIARNAVEEYRRTSVRHIGRHARRINYPGGSSRREWVFQQKWIETNNPASWVNYGIGTLENLLVRADDGRFERELTPAEATAVATVIQWLGTNVGWCWLERCIEECGYKLTPKKDER